MRQMTVLLAIVVVSSKSTIGIHYLLQMWAITIQAWQRQASLDESVEKTTEEPPKTKKKRGFFGMSFYFIFFNQSERCKL